jgi:hypothetical protein
VDDTVDETQDGSDVGPGPNESDRPDVLAWSVPMRLRLMAVELTERGNSALNALASKDRFAMTRVTEALSVAMELAELIATAKVPTEV